MTKVSQYKAKTFRDLAELRAKEKADDLYHSLKTSRVLYQTYKYKVGLKSTSKQMLPYLNEDCTQALALGVVISPFPTKRFQTSFVSENSVFDS